MSKITSLTPEQETALPAFREEWFRIGSCTEPADRVTTERVWREWYEKAGHDEPRFIWADSPLTAHILMAVFDTGGSLQASLRTSLGDSLWNSLRTSLWNSLRTSLRTRLQDSLEVSLGDSLQASLQDSLWDSLQVSLEDSLWNSLGASLRDSLGVRLLDSLGDSLWASLRTSLGDSLQGSLWNRLQGSLGDSLQDSLRDRLWDSLRDSLRDSLGASLQGSLWNRLQDSLEDSLEDSLDSLQASLEDSLRVSLGDRLLDSLGVSLGYSLQARLQDSLQDSLQGSLRDRLWDSLRGSLRVSLGTSLRDSLQDSLRDRLWDSLRGSLGDSLRDRLWDSLRGSLGDRLSYRSTWWWGSIDTYWIAYYLFSGQVGRCYSEEQTRDLARFADYARSGFWAWPFEGLVVLSERPSEIHWGENAGGTKVLSRLDGPAIRFRDGWGVYVVDGVRVPEWIIEDKGSITVDKIESEDNAEVRRIMAEIYGLESYLVDSGAKLVAMDSVPIESWNESAGSIERALVEDNKGTKWLIACDGSTERTYTLRAPDDAETPEDAYRAIAGAGSEKCLAQG